jgi:ABC-type phosphate/phosphonate transport system substrate-binding protein
MVTRNELRFGFAEPEGNASAKRDMTELMAFVSANAAVHIEVNALPSYERVAQLVHKGEIDLAWLSPIPFISLLRNESVVPLACPQRGGTHYHGALVVGADAAVGDLSLLAAQRAAWVDRYSAAGFVVPRIELAKAGFDVKSGFASQRFFGSHAAVARAVADGLADFGATFVRLASNGAVVGGPWLNDPALERRLRIFATFGEIPPDVIAARDGLDASIRDRLRAALLAIPHTGRSAELLGEVFGAEGLFIPNVDSYEALRESAAAAVRAQLLDIEDVSLQSI